MANIYSNKKLLALNININFQFDGCLDCDILALKFDESDIENQKKLLKSALPKINKPLMICGSGKDDFDSELLPELISVLDRECIISYGVEKNYKKIVPSVIKGGHYLVLKTPIDLTLAKELNILANDLGLEFDKILMNTDIGALGYGYEYGYSLMEKAVLEVQRGDKYLDVPIVSEAPLESLKTKEAKMSLNRAKMMEISSASGAFASGANIVVVKHPECVKYLKEVIEK